MPYRTIRVASSPGEPGESPELAEDIALTEVEVRVLGSLVEKSITTPEYYPLSLNSLVTACNQKSSRDPVVSYDEQTVSRTLERLMDKGLVRRVVSSDGGRVDRYRQLFFEAFRLNQAQGSLLCVLMLRGPQTPGELRQRTARLCEFESLAEVEEGITWLCERQPRPFAAKLTRKAGTKEARYAQLLSGAIAQEEPATAPGAPSPEAETPNRDDRLQQLEGEVAALRAELERLQLQFDDFRKQFD